ncbi:hypothetical protein LCGC14_3052860 [marine sediment metagenome]|uniref:Uncharacterized protein n=1 Tax=marine sediment metagenome TaxID=412755 RepID=A0A0F8WLM6_9ZZZZ
MQRLFDPKSRDKAIDTTCSYLVMAGLLLPDEVTYYMSVLTGYDDERLARVLLESRQEYNVALAVDAIKRSN